MLDLPTNLRCVPDFAQCDALVRAALTGDDPVFVSRIGGSDTDFIVRVLAAASIEGFPAAIARYEWDRHIAEKFNGLYDKHDIISEAERYCRTLMSAYLRQSMTFVCNPPLLTRLMPSTINEVFQSFSEELGPKLISLVDMIASRTQELTALPYDFVERTLNPGPTLFRLFADVLPGSRVLVVSPLTRSINANFINRRNFFPDYDYPEFELSCYTTPITYAGLPLSMYPDDNWSTTALRMEAEIATLDFDIALLSCGSYAMPLGDAIAHRMGKKAVYVGGCLQLFFGIMGRRYRNPYFEDVIDNRYFIEPVEKQEFAPHYTVSEETAKDAFGAYF